MNILDILNAPWAIEPSKLLEIHAVYAAHLAGERIDLKAVEARIGRPLANEQKPYQVVDGVGIISVEGVIAKKANMFADISGGASSQAARNSLALANADPLVHSIILAVDSPGGTVDGIQTLTDSVRASRTAKKVVTLGSGMIASAAYWFGSAAGEVYIAENTTAVGSIGVVTAHRDVSGQEAARGIKTTELSAGKYKRIASQFGPLSEDGRQSIQAHLDYMYSLFVDAVAANRGTTADVVLEKMADGRVFIGQQAIDAGLVDGVITLEALIEKLNTDRGLAGRAPTPSRAGPARNPTTKLSGATVDRAEIEANHPALAAELRADGARQERERIQAVEGQLIAGHEALINTLKFDGTSDAGAAAVAVLSAEKKARQAHADASKNDAPSPVKVVPAATVVPPAAEAGADTPEAMAAKTKAYMAEHPNTTFLAAYKAVGGK
jgi:signal peptide peptidase SppA